MVCPSQPAWVTPCPRIAPSLSPSFRGTQRRQALLKESSSATAEVGDSGLQLCPELLHGVVIRACPVFLGSTRCNAEHGVRLCSKCSLSSRGAHRHLPTVLRSSLGPDGQGCTKALSRPWGGGPVGQRWERATPRAGEPPEKGGKEKARPEGAGDLQQRLGEWVTGPWVRSGSPCPGLVHAGDPQSHSPSSPGPYVVKAHTHFMYLSLFACLELLPLQ